MRPLRFLGLCAFFASWVVGCGDDRGTAGTAGGDTTSAGGGNSSGGGGAGGTGCSPGAGEACYTGPAGTEGVGPCAAGTRTCLSDGSGFGECEGEVLPAAETCGTPDDDDCDGDTNEEGPGCVCLPNSNTSCYSGPPGTAGVGICAAGTQACNAQGTDLGPCTGEVLPALESCATPEDDDCDSLAPGCPGSHVWSKRFGDMGGQVAWDVTTDSGGNIVLTGVFTGTVDFGGGPLENPRSAVDMFVAKLDAAGNHLWSKSFGGSYGQSGMSVSTDAAGNIVLTGTFEGAIDLGGGVLTSAGGDDIFVAELDASGNHVWSKRFGDGGSQYGRAVATDSAGNVLLTGFVEGEVDFGGGPTTGVGGYDVFVTKLDASGNHVWSKRVGGSSSQYGAGLATTGAGAVVVTGYFGGTVDFGGGALGSAGGDDIFVAKLDASGNHVWSKRFGAGGYESGRAVALDGSGNVTVTGELYDTVDFGGGPLTSAGSADIFLARLDALGNHVWSRRFGSSEEQGGAAVATDSAGNVALTGYFFGTVDFGGGPLSAADNVFGDAFIASLDASGNHAWSRRFGDTGPQAGRCVTTDPSGNVVVSGGFAGSVDFGGGALTAAAETDVFVAKFGL